MTRPQEKETRQVTHRVIALLNREQVDFLDKLGKDALFTTGAKLSRTKIIYTMVNALRALGVTGDGVRSKEELEQKIIKAGFDQQHFTDLRDDLLRKKAV
ncbi:MAG: hypothetical protein HY590_05890 [Candidatus Omnitrophica bacterium]|nr:hypothetical protein [Candidatus Omnitrophota bacterium]